VILVLPSLLTCTGPMSVYDRRSYVFVISEINASVFKYLSYWCHLRFAVTTYPAAG